ncbi:MAG: hypothetical protein QGF59_01800, partial [Pirellulaceae bacterium]|nr:hypothetical protein [Pirellulaceae bacterium]
MNLHFPEFTWLTNHILCLIFLTILCTTSAEQIRADEVDKLLQVVAEVGPGGVGSSAARVATDRLGQHGVAILPQLLNAMDTPNFVAANWYRTVYERIVAGESAKDRPAFPVEYLQEFVRDSERQGRLRALVLRLLDKLTPGYRESILPGLIHDAHFRDDAVAFVLSRGDKAKADGDTQAAKRDFQAAFKYARDVAHITRAADRLKVIGVDVDIVEQMGFVTNWYLIGPFDAPLRTGFDKVFPPETSVDLQASYVGKGERKIKWKLFHTDDRLGQVDLIRAITSVKEAVGYAYAELDAPADQELQLLCGADDNLSVWLNGEKIFARRQWLNGTRLDRFAAPAFFKKGRNKLL